MAFTIDFRDGDVLEWHATPDGVEVRTVTSYTPTLYVNAASRAELTDLAEAVTKRGDVTSIAWESWRPAFRRDPERMLRLDVSSIDRVRPVAGWIRRSARPGTYRLFNVDFSREFRYCLERGLDPTPDRPLTELELTHPGPGQPSPPVERLRVGSEPSDGTGGEPSDETSCETSDGTSDAVMADADTGMTDADASVRGPDTVVDTVRDTLARVDPDVLVLSSAELVPALVETAQQLDRELHLGRRPGYEQLAGESTYESYGQVGHSPARYNVPGRVIVDRSNTFFYRETNLEGCLDLVRRSRKPLQELSWASIGNVLTAIQSREALDRGVLVPWKSWRHEFPKTMAQLHAADRGGFTFSPDVGVHEDVHELDFSSLYPNIICTRNVSPETIRCECHDRADVPGLGYSICDEPGYLPEVLQPIVDARDDLKASLDATDDPKEQRARQGQADALKWILVSCFGYQGFSNAKFGRIECHEAINAFAREILLDAKEHLEDAGWEVRHGIVDSLWVTARPGESQRPLDAVASEVTDATGIRLEYEAAYDWLAFVPLRTSDAGALTKYFGRRRDGSSKFRGIECRQRSTPPFVADCQRALVEAFDRTRDPQAVCHELASWLADLDAGTVDSAELVVTTRTSKSLEEYDQQTRTTAALERRASGGIEHAPGRDVEYVVVDDDATGRARVRLPHEAGDYDVSFYRERLLEAAESVLSPVGWRQSDIEDELDGCDSRTLSRFVSGSSSSD